MALLVLGVIFALILDPYKRNSKVYYSRLIFEDIGDKDSNGQRPDVPKTLPHLSHRPTSVFCPSQPHRP